MENINKKAEFIEEYNKLCLKFGVFVISEDPYCGVELGSLRKDEDFELHKLQLKQLNGKG